MKKRLATSVLLVLGIFQAVFGQNSDNKNSADRALHGSGRVNASTLGMEVDIPLGAYPGRGINVPISLSYSSKIWRLHHNGNFPDSGGNSSPCFARYLPEYAEDSASGWTTSLAVPYIEYTGMLNFYNFDGTPVSYEDLDCPTTNPPPGNYPHHFIRRLVVHLPSGETHELRADDTVTAFTAGTSVPNDPIMWDRTFYAVDGSNIKYVQHAATDTYRLLMPDGSFYDFHNEMAEGVTRKATKFTDRNGNFTTYYAPGSTDDQNVTHPNGYWKDTLGRNISIPLKPNAPNAPTSAGNPQIYAMPGMMGTYKLHWKRLNGGTQDNSALTDITDPAYEIRYPGNNYTCNNNSGYPSMCWRTSATLFFGDDVTRVMGLYLFNPTVLTEIELPTGQRYKFTYDIYGRIEQIIYPTGGKEVFQYSVVPTLSVLGHDDLAGNANFGVSERKVYPNANESANYQWTYTAGQVGTSAYAVVMNNPDGTRTERYLHQGTPAESPMGFGYDNILAGMAFEEHAYNSVGSGQLVSKKITTWTKTSLTTSGGGQVAAALWHPRITQEESILYESGSGISTTATYNYYDEANLNLRETPVLMKKSSQYAFVAAGNPLPALPVRTSETTFLQEESLDNYPQWVKDAYKVQNMMGLATASTISDGAGTVVARSEMKYDDGEYSPNVGRGNPTTARVWDSTKGGWDNPNAYIQTRARFDGYGNQYEAIDAKGNVTQTTFDTTYHTYPLTVTSAIPDPTNQHGSNEAFTTSATFNTITGLPLTTTDANLQTTTIEYDAATLRPIRVIPPTGAGISETIYHDEPNNYWVKNRAQIDATNWAESITYFDGLGRAYKAEEINSQGNIFVEKEFDQDGRVSRVTNPYRTGETKQWTTNVYDESSRVKQVTLPDGATVKTDFGVSTSGIIGVTKQITDQAGKRRKGFSDALGRMVRVIEDPTIPTQTGQDLSTDYVFDTLGNLRKTIQGEQSRYFTHDSLGRLLRAKQPEQEVNPALALPVADAITGHNQWSVGYEYDDNGNITSTTDAKGVSVTGTYDNFNRLKVRNYSDATPDVNFYYDGKYLNISDQLQTATGSVKGKTTGIKSSVSKTNYTAFNNLGQLLTHQQITDGQTYQTGYTYDSFGRMISETYPSMRTVKVDYNSDGDVSSIWGTVGANNRLYANGFTYNSSGAMERMRLGNGKWESYAYNNRLQVTEIGLGNSATDTSLLKLEYGYGSNTENNGNLRTQKISFNGLAQPFEQTYTYDSLNRLQSAEEKVNAATTWKQTFQYDRFGNRRFDANNTTTLGSCSQAQCNPLINTSDNRFSSGQNYIYDENGNLTRDANSKKFTYDAENHQIKVETVDANGNPISTNGEYLYDGEGKRVKKVSSTEITVFVYNGGGQLVAEYSTQTVTTPQVSYLTADHLGSPRVITNQNGAVTTRKDYAAFGEELSTSQRTSGLSYDSSETRKGYTGYEKDSESGLEFAQARYYNSTHGRFTSVDPLTASANVKNPQTFNRYSYVLNSPYKFVDPLGLISSSTGAHGNKENISNWCDLECRAKTGINLSKQDLALLQWHVANGTALGYTYQNASQNQQSQEQSSDSAGDSGANGDQSSQSAQDVAENEHSQTSNNQSNRRNFPQAPSAEKIISSFSYVFVNLLKNRSGHRTNKPLENGGWVYQKKNGKLFYVLAADWRRSEDAINLQDPPVYKNARVVASFHTHPFTDKKQDDANREFAAGSGFGTGAHRGDEKVAENNGYPGIIIYEERKNVTATTWVGPDRLNK